MSKEEIRSFQERWMRPAGIAAIFGAFLIVGSVIAGRAGIPAADGTAEQLLNYQDHAGQLQFSAILSGLGILTFAFPLWFLFRSALARPLPERVAVEGRKTARMRGFLGAFVIAGPLFVALQGILLSFVLADASDKYVAGVAEVEAKARAAAAEGAPARNENGVSTVTTTATLTTTTTATTAKGATKPTTTTQTIPEGACTKPVEDCVDDAKDDFAEDQITDAGAYTAANVTGLFGALMFLGGGIYTLVWCMRTGLLTRPIATIGMIFIAALLLIPPLGPFGLLLWFAFLGLMLAGWWPRPLPPAWEALEAVPWPRAGEDLGPPVERPPSSTTPSGTTPSGTVEGSGREVSEPPLPEESPADGPTLGGTQGERRKKRKRRN
jgi:hypothetical protein